jgi:hypothetical protein
MALLTPVGQGSGSSLDLIISLRRRPVRKQEMLGIKITILQLLSVGHSTDVQAKSTQSPSSKPGIISPHCVLGLLKHASLKDKPAKTCRYRKGAFRPRGWLYRWWKGSEVW